MALVFDGQGLLIRFHFKERIADLNLAQIQITLNNCGNFWNFGGDHGKMTRRRQQLAASNYLEKSPGLCCQWNLSHSIRFT